MDSLRSRHSLQSDMRDRKRTWSAAFQHRQVRRHDLDLPHYTTLVRRPRSGCSGVHLLLALARRMREPLRVDDGMEMMIEQGIFRLGRVGAARDALLSVAATVEVAMAGRGRTGR